MVHIYTYEKAHTIVFWFDENGFSADIIPTKHTLPIIHVTPRVVAKSAFTIEFIDSIKEKLAIKLELLLSDDLYGYSTVTNTELKFILMGVLTKIESIVNGFHVVVTDSKNNRW